MLFRRLTLTVLAALLGCGMAIAKPKSKPLTDESKGHCIVTQGIIFEYGFSVSITLFSVINSIARLIAELLPIPEFPIMVKLSLPPIIPLYSLLRIALKFSFCCMVESFVCFLLRERIKDRYSLL